MPCEVSPFWTFVNANPGTALLMVFAICWALACLAGAFRL